MNIDPDLYETLRNQGIADHRLCRIDSEKGTGRLPGVTERQCRRVQRTIKYLWISLLKIANRRPDEEELSTICKIYMPVRIPEDSLHSPAPSPLLTAQSPTCLPIPNISIQKPASTRLHSKP